MSILDSVKEKANAFMGKEGQSLEMVTQLFSDTGGATGLVEKLKAAGLSDTVKSWMSAGTHQSISVEQIQKIVGPEEIKKLADKYGLDSNQICTQLSSNLPKVMEKLSSNGSLPSEDQIKTKLTDIKSFFH